MYKNNNDIGPYIKDIMYNMIYFYLIYNIIFSFGLFIIYLFYILSDLADYIYTRDTNSIL